MTTATLHASRKTKPTAIGELPVEWGVSPLGKCAQLERGKFAFRPRTEPRFYGGKTPFVQTGDVSNARTWIRSYTQTLSEEGLAISKVFPKGTILMTIAANIGDCAMLDFDSACPDSIIGILPRDGVDGLFLLYTLIHRKHYLHYLAPAGAQKNLNLNFLQKVEVPVPPLPEQERIAAVLGTWDRALERLEKLLTAKHQFKRGLMQQLLTGKRRFCEFSKSQWTKTKIGEFTRPAQRIVKKPDKAFKALGIRSHGKGTFLKENFDPAAIELTELFEVKKDDLIVNITFGWEGAIAIAGASDDGALVSHRFPTYVFNTTQVIPEYFRHVITQRIFVRKLGLISPGGAGRNRVLSKRDFPKIEVPIPTVAEQQRIAAVLNGCDREIQLLQSELAALKDQKRGLMQRLLTGKVRVKT